MTGENKAAQTVTTRRIYLGDLARYEADGWQPCQDGQGRIKVLMTPTGEQCYVWQTRPVQ